MDVWASEKTKSSQYQMKQLQKTFSEKSLGPTDQITLRAKKSKGLDRSIISKHSKRSKKASMNSS